MHNKKKTKPQLVLKMYFILFIFLKTIKNEPFCDLQKKKTGLKWKILCICCCGSGAEMNVRQSVQLLVVNGAERGLDPLNIQSHSHSTEESKQCDDSDWIGPIMTVNSLMRI